LQIRSNNVSETFKAPSVKATYPFLEVLSPGDALPILLESLPGGDLPVVITLDGKRLEVIRIARTPITVRALLNVYPLVAHINQGKQVPIEHVSQLMDMEDFTWTASS
jgi:hypothetical protein